MTEHLSGGLIDRYLARKLAPVDVLELHVHLETCPQCRRALEQASIARLSPASVPLLYDHAEPHLSEEEMVAWVAGRLPEPQRGSAARHVAGCEICRDSVAAMESVGEQPAAGRSRSRAARWVALSAIAAGLLVAVLLRDRSAHPQVSPPAIVASLRDGGLTIELDSGGALRGLAGTSPEEQNLVRDALRQGTLPFGPALAAQATGVLLAPDAAPAHFSPTAPIDSRVLSDRPVFTWTNYAGATAYQVLVTTETLDPLLRSAKIAATEWQPDVPLPRGVILLWQVRAWKGGEMVSAPAPPAPPARFEIAGEAVAARLQQLRASPQSSHLLAAVLSAREGLREEAAKELEMLAQENPGSPVVRRLQGR